MNRNKSIWILKGIFASFLIFSCTSDDDSDSNSQSVDCSTYQTVYCPDLCDWYNDQDIIVTDEFSGKCLELKGRIRKINDRSDHAVITLDSYGESTCLEVLLNFDVECRFYGDYNSTEYRTIINNYEVGDFIAIKGEFQREKTIIDEIYILYANDLSPEIVSRTNDCGISGKRWKCELTSDNCERFYYWFIPRGDKSLLYVSYDNIHKEDEPQYGTRTFEYVIADGCEKLTLIDPQSNEIKEYSIIELSRNTLILEDEQNNLTNLSF